MDRNELFLFVLLGYEYDSQHYRYHGGPFPPPRTSQFTHWSQQDAPILLCQHHSAEWDDSRSHLPAGIVGCAERQIGVMLLMKDLNAASRPVSGLAGLRGGMGFCGTCGI